MQNFDTAPYPWQQNHWNRLLHSYQSNQLPHALLLTGASGLGQWEFALALAQQVLCEQGREKTLPCRQCRACLLIQAHSHPDVYNLQPEEPGKAIRIDVIREMIKQLSQTALHNHYKIVLIQPAEAMNLAASNALLKNLEEPAGNTLFLLVSSELSQLPATVRSRCQLITFTAPAKEIAHAWLQPLLKQGQDSELLLALAGQAPLQALKLAYEERLKEREQLFIDLKKISENKAMPVQVAAQWLKTEPKALLTALINIIIDCIRINMSLPADSLLNTDKIDFIKQVANVIAAMTLFNYLDELYQWRNQLNTSVQINQQLLIETLFCRWYHYARFTRT